MTAKDDFTVNMDIVPSEVMIALSEVSKARIVQILRQLLNWPEFEGGTALENGEVTLLVTTKKITT